MMYKSFYQMALIGLSVILVGVMAIAGLKLTQMALANSMVVTQAETTVLDNYHYVGEATDTINKEQHSVKELFSILKTEEHLVDKILNYEI